MCGDGGDDFFDGYGPGNAGAFADAGEHCGGFGVAGADESDPGDHLQQHPLELADGTGGGIGRCA